MLLGMKQGKIVLLGAILFSAFTLPLHARAQLFVPVDTGLDDGIDTLNLSATDLNNKIDDLTIAFKDYTLDNASSSLRAFLSLNPGPGLAAELYNPGTHIYEGGGKTAKPVTTCKLRPITNPTGASPTDDGAWQQLINDEVLDDSGNYAGVQVNDSTSISCLLQEIVEQNKLSANLQIHQLLNNYIQSAQAKALAQRLKDKQVQASLNFINNGNLIVIKDDSGNVVSEKSFPLTGNPRDLNDTLLQNNIRRYTDAALGVGPTQSFNTPFRQEVAVAIQQAGHNTAGDNFSEAAKSLNSTAGTDGSHFASMDMLKRFLSGDTEGTYSGSYFGALKEASLPANNPLGATELASQVVEQTSANIEETTANGRNQGGGVGPYYRCRPDDFYCADPEEQTGTFAKSNAETGLNSKINDLSNVNDATDLAKLDANGESATQVIENGGTPTEEDTTGQSAGAYVAEFFDTIRSGYFDLQGGTVDWALGAMLQIYDHTVTGADQISPDGKETTATN